MHRLFATESALGKSDLAQHQAALTAWAERAWASMQRMPAFERAPLIAEIARMQGGPLVVGGGLDRAECLSRLARLAELSQVAIAAQNVPQKHADRGGWHPLRTATPGKHSGTRREPDAGWS